MHPKEIQIVTFNTPFPANYGGVIDVFYKVKALHQLGIKIHLHTFYDDRNQLDELQNYCENIYLYKRKKSLWKYLSTLPFAISSRTSKVLIERLKSNTAPILFESLKSLYPLTKVDFSQRVGIRCQNIEHLYTLGLYKSEKNWLKKIAFYAESKKLNRIQHLYKKADFLFTISNHEQNYFSHNFKTKSELLPVFHGNTKINSKPGFGKYALYHGDLSIADNIKSALFIISVFKELKHQLIIASSSIPKNIISFIDNSQHIKFVVISNNNHLQDLINNAHINTLYSFQQSGTKLKVFNALFNGRHCIVNSNMVDDENILSICQVVENKSNYKKIVNELFDQPFKLTTSRIEALKRYNDLDNAKIIIEKLLT